MGSFSIWQGLILVLIGLAIWLIYRQRGSMKQYKVFTNPSGLTEAVKQGWSWPAFFFNAIWAMVKKMWGIGVGFFLGFSVLGFILGLIGSEGLVVQGLINICAFIANIVFGINGNSWREKNLLSRGFELVNTVTAENSEGAIALHLKAAPATVR